jgi:4-alpha-glucanotransferase
MATPTEALQQLARLYGVQTSYYDVVGRLQQASTEALVRVLRALGAEIERVEDAPPAMRQRKQTQWRRWLDPVTVAWDGTCEGASVRLPGNRAASAINCRLALENGAVQEWSARASDLAQIGSADVESVQYTARRLTIPGRLPLGYHRLQIEIGGRTAEALVLSAPTRAYEPKEHQRSSWGVFLPLYALHTERSWGAGDFTDLEELIEWVLGLGGGMVATLPLLAAFLDEPFEPGPYSPASRLFWNEFYLDVARIPELQRCPTAQARLASPELQSRIQELRHDPLVDYRKQMALKRSVLEELAYSFFTNPVEERRKAFEQFLSTHPHAEDYACFRAVGERRRAPWPAWPSPLRDGQIHEGDYDARARDYHLYVQWLADEQLQALAQKARGGGPGLYLDLPLGVNSDSYDVWRERKAFATGIAAGAPPDPFFAKGQNWGFPPLHPDEIREQGYRYLRSYIAHHLRLAGVLRIDHMMGLHRLFWVPHGMDAKEGVYVQYPAEEQYAVFTLESNRFQSVLVGEDLGTVPPEVPPAMARHNVHRMYVLQYELQPQYQAALTEVYAGSVASLNTHDMPPFAAFWQGLDFHDRIELGILDERMAEEERRRRKVLLDAAVQYFRNMGRLHESSDPMALLKACLTYMGGGSAMVVLANLEDLWMETHAQNMPGTWREQPNWRRRSRYSLSTIRRMPEVLETLWEIAEAIRSQRQTVPV